MRISDLSAASDVPIPTIKFYLRQGLLQPGERTARNQATYGEPHLRRLRLIRALVDVGALSLDAVKRVLDALADESLGLHGALSVAHGALNQPSPDRPGLAEARAEIDAWLTALGWEVSPQAPARATLALALLSLRESGWDAAPNIFRRYADHADVIARDELAFVAGRPTPESAVEATVVGTIVFERALLALRRLAEERHSRLIIGRPGP